MTVMNNYCYIQPTITAETYLTCSSGTDFNGNPTDLTRGVLDFGVTYCERDMFSEGKLDRDFVGALRLTDVSAWFCGHKLIHRINY